MFSPSLCKSYILPVYNNERRERKKEKPRQLTYITKKDKKVKDTGYLADSSIFLSIWCIGGAMCFISCMAIFICVAYVVFSVVYIWFVTCGVETINPITYDNATIISKVPHSSYYDIAFEVDRHILTGRIKARVCTVEQADPQIQFNKLVVGENYVLDITGTRIVWLGLYKQIMYIEEIE